MLDNINVDDMLNIENYGKTKVTIFEILEMISEKNGSPKNTKALAFH